MKRKLCLWPYFAHFIVFHRLIKQIDLDALNFKPFLFFSTAVLKVEFDKKNITIFLFREIFGTPCLHLIYFIIVFIPLEPS